MRAEIWTQIRLLPDTAVVVLEMIKLLESGWVNYCDEIWVTNCPEAMQLRRLLQTRGMTEDEARTRIAAQAPQADKVARADVVIDTSGSLAHTREQVRSAWTRFNTANRARTAQ